MANRKPCKHCGSDRGHFQWCPIISNMVDRDGAMLLTAIIMVVALAVGLVIGAIIW